jgi:hypothetical protein
MKTLTRLFLATVLVTVAGAQPTTFTLNPLASFGGRGDGSIQPGDSIGTSPLTGNDVKISALGGFGIQPGDSVSAPISTNGFNMRGLAWDPVSGNLVFVDTHTGQNGATFMVPNSAVYILNPNSGQIIGALNTNGVFGGGGIGAVAAVGVADDGAIYVANQINNSGTSGFKIYRWPTANINDPSFSQPPVVAFTNTLSPAERLGQTIDVRGAGTNTQIIIGSGVQSGQPGTNIYLFTTADGTNFTPHRLTFPGINTAVFNDGIAFGEGNTFWTKQVAQPLLYFSFDPVNFTNNAIIASYKASSVNDPLLNLSAIAVDNVHHLLASLEEIGGIATGGRGKVWLFDISNPTNRPPAVLSSRTYIPNLQKATAPMGYLDFANGKLYANVVNNGLLASTVDPVPLSPPTFTTDLPASTRVSVGQSAHLEVLAVIDVTNYQWFSNNVAIAGATSYSIDVLNVQTNMSGIVYKVVASNAAGSTESVNSTLTVVSAANFFHPNLLWSKTATTTALTDPTNYITSSGATGTPNERCIAYNALSNQLLVVRGPVSVTSLKIFVLDADTGNFLYLLKTNGITGSGALTLCGIGVADDGAVYAASVDAATGPLNNDQSFKVYRWANTDSNTLPQVIFGTNSPAANGNPISDLVGSVYYRFGDNLALRGAENNTEIIVDSQNSSKFVGILRPTPDGTMTNWTQTGYLLQNIQGSYGAEAYGTGIGRSLQFGNANTFWQKRYNAAAGAPLAQMSYNPGGGLAPLVVANTSAGLFTNGSIAISPTLGLAAGVNFVGSIASDSSTAADTLDYYDFTDPSQAVLLSRQILPGGNSGSHKGNQNAVAQVVFGANPTTGLNYLFAIDGNNGIAAYALVGGVTPPPKILAQPRDLRVLEGSSGSLSTSIDQPATIQWFKGTNSPVNTGVAGLSYNIVNAQSSDSGDYFMIATNINGAVTSRVAHVSVGLINDNYSLSPAWGAIPGNANYPYVTSTGGANTPNERAFAFNALSNQLIVVRCAPNSTAYSLWVVDAASGTNLYTLNTTGVIHEGPSEVSGANAIDLVGAAASDDGSIYICSESPNASGGAAGDPTKMFNVFRWANSGPATAPVLVYQGDPSGQPAGISRRWGDVLAVRGGGTNTELFVNSFEGDYGAVLRPLDATLNAFTNGWFADSAGGGSIGRSVQFGANNTVLEKRKGAALVYSSYDLTNQVSLGVLSIDSSTTLGGVAVDSARKLMAGVDFVGSTTAPAKPDALALYDISDPLSPMFIQRYNFPVNQIANANVLCQTIITSNRIYALDANNGLIALDIVAPANSAGRPVLNLSVTGKNVTLSWAASGFILEATSSLTTPTTWVPLTSGSETNLTQDASSGIRFYRLRK